ncbi:MAG: hypothetical protein AAF824_13300, partial [Bacteroidota bacterium]
ANATLQATHYRWLDGQPTSYLSFQTTYALRYTGSFLMPILPLFTSFRWALWAWKEVSNGISHLI